MKIILRGDDTLQLVDIFLNSESTPPLFKYGKELQMELEFYHANGSEYTEAELNTFDKFQFGIDKDFDFITPAAALTLAGFTVSGNIISFLLRTDAARFKSLLGTNAITSAVAQFKAYLSGKTLPKISEQFPVTLENAVIPDTESQPEPKLQFSIDGATLWHDDQAVADEYVRVSRNDGTLWTIAVKLPAGLIGANGALGADGAPAPLLQIQFSVDGATAWHSPFADGDLYLRTSSDNGSTWSPAIKFVGGGTGTGTDTLAMLAQNYFDDLVYRAETAQELIGGMVDVFNDSSGVDLENSINIRQGENNNNTKLLLQNSIADSAAGVGTPASIVNDGVTVDGNGDLIFDGASKLTVDYTSGGLLNAWGTNTEWTLDFDITLTNGAVMWCKMSGVWVGILGVEGNSTPSVWLGGEGSTIPVSSTVKTTITIENWLDGATWTSTYYKNGVVQETRLNENWGPITDDFIIGRRDNFMTGKLNRIRLSNVGLHQGQAFTLVPVGMDYISFVMSPSETVPGTPDNMTILSNAVIDLDIPTEEEVVAHIETTGTAGTDWKISVEAANNVWQEITMDKIQDYGNNQGMWRGTVELAGAGTSRRYKVETFNNTAFKLHKIFTNWR